MAASTEPADDDVDTDDVDTDDDDDDEGDVLKLLWPDEKLEVVDDAPVPEPPVVTPACAEAVVAEIDAISTATRDNDAKRMNNGFTVEEMVCPARIGNGVNRV